MIEALAPVCLTVGCSLIDEGFNLKTMSFHDFGDFKRELFARLLAALSARVKVETTGSRALCKDVLLEVLVIPPEGTAHATNAGIATSPASVTANKASKGGAHNAKSVAKSDS